MMRILSARNRTQVLKPALPLARLYQSERKRGFQAKHALFNAQTRLEWDKHEVAEYSSGEAIDPQPGSVRLRILPDDHVDLDNLFGDTYNPQVNSDIPETRLEREREQEVDRVNRDGVWGIVGEYFDGEEWQHGDSCWGFVGDDWKHSGYDTDIMHATLNAAQSIRVCPTCKRPYKKAN